MDAQNKNILDSKFICARCSFILSEPVQLKRCGHRICQSCLDTLNQNTVKCPQCQIETPQNQIMSDRDFKNNMQCLPIICSLCNWNGILIDYQEHLVQSHPNTKCNYCDEECNSINHLNQHKAFHCSNIAIECQLKNFGCHQEIPRFELKAHYQSKQHQDSMLEVIKQLKLQLSEAQAASTSMDSDVSRTTTTTDDDNFVANQLEQLQETINMLANGTAILNEETQQLGTEFLEHQNKRQGLVENTSNVKLAVEEEQLLNEAITQNLEILNQNLLSLREKIDDKQCTSYDGSFTWKIKDFREKMADAQSEKQASIYSPPFYSSPTGYKMRARLYLNGDGNARRTHMSLFFVLMRGQHDQILKFPFNYKVTFCMYDQTPQRRHIIDSFRPDIRSSSFHRPRSDMNIASGIPKFYPLVKILEEGNPYVQDDTIFIKVMVDFGDLPKTILPYALSLNPGLPTDVQQHFIRQALEKKAEIQTSKEHSTTDT
ncbi:unnamed protein product [Rotaria socialis]|uniref:Uncharacterized protein n=1 Tax=Rotaria socialis TaxID=392032 RepID=A0A817U2Q0_9BILA|nr:unnamed protein product [Rotaria socialis]CAF3314755.1 unnamed protein product [Rotaria socialis]CAF3323786.1 unnamed protein product [Rotaria socialis]CAF3324414.1 unnamed protein product [Rotaria socialis]CAF3523305.1 unnamed protein product [Rotaria socialis]